MKKSRSRKYEGGGEEGDAEAPAEAAPEEPAAEEEQPLVEEKAESV